MSHGKITVEDLLEFYHGDSYTPTARLLKLYRASQYLRLDWDEYYEDQEKAEVFKKKQEDIRFWLKAILDTREHVPRRLEGKILRKVMAKYHLNKEEARRFALEHKISLKYMPL
jgi:hypothetical protein